MSTSFISIVMAGINKIKNSTTWFQTVTFALIIVLCVSVPLSYALPMVIDEDATLNIPSSELANPLNWPDDLIINGRLNINSTGSVSNSRGIIGDYAGSTGVVTVTGVGSNWTNSDQLHVGERGKGELTISNGGMVSNVNSVIGAEANSSGKVTVTGSGSTWNDSGNNFDVGDQGKGELTISEGGTVNSVTGTIGFQPGSSGTVTVTGNGSNWTNSDQLLVGNQEKGELTISNGGMVSNVNSVIGAEANSSGKVTVTGVGSTWNDSGNNFDVGDYGTGELTISEGGTVNSVTGTIGFQPGSSGTVTVTGNGSNWTNSDQLHVGERGKGELTISNGGMVSNVNSVIGAEANSSGKVTVTGSGSTWNDSGNNFDVGNQGKGELTISEGGKVSNTSGYVGYAEGSTGTVTVTGNGSNWTNSDQLHVGERGKGELAIKNKGVVSNTEGVIGYSVGSSGAVTVTGGGSQWNNNRELFVGYTGNGGLTISDGGTVSNTIGYVGTAAGSTGAVTVTGVGSQWNNSGYLHVGNLGTGELTISNGGMVSAVNGVVVALGEGSTGRLNISSDCTLQTQALIAGEGRVIVSTFDSGTLRAVADTSSFITGFRPGELIINAGGLTIDDNGYEVATDSSALGGVGGLTKTGTGILTLGGLNTYAGATTVTAGTLKAGTANALSSASAFIVNNEGALDLDGYRQTVAGLTNSGIVQIGASDSTTPVGATLTVNGNYQSDGGILSLRTMLEGDTSLTDKLHVTGNTSGYTDVMINNAGGNGAQTINDIEIVAVDGNSAGTFGNSQRVVAGAHDYFVRSGSTLSGKNANNWYLVSAFSESLDVPSTPVYRPEAGSYLDNLAASNTLFVTRLHDRLGKAQYGDVLAGEKKVTDMWMRHVANHNSFRDSTGQIRISGNSYVIQIGGDLAQWSNNGTDSWHLGVMGGYAYSSGKSNSMITNYFAKGSASGYSVGLYGTWYANQADKSGAYFDSWVLYNWFDNKVDGWQLQREKYKSKGVTASIEGGYSFLLGEKNRTNYWLQPKAQLIWMGVTADDHTEANGTRVRSDTDNNLMTRLGMRAYANIHSKDEIKDYAYQPFVELNWIHNTNDYAVMMNDVMISQKGANNLGEIRIGVEGKFKNNLTFWANIGYQLGRDSYRNTVGMFGIKYIF